MHCYSGDQKKKTKTNTKNKNTKKYGLFSKHLFQRKQDTDGWKEPEGNKKL